MNAGLRRRWPAESSEQRRGGSSLEYNADATIRPVCELHNSAGRDLYIIMRGIGQGDDPAFFFKPVRSGEAGITWNESKDI